ncbi:hypothetical protein C8J57DRAFT_1736220 [Mycena rebaudengoi]|nr:hypothetical protein C8J57DRAFT_1736220 [Mycena rebaudengoi]
MDSFAPIDLGLCAAAASAPDTASSREYTYITHIAPPHAPILRLVSISIVPTTTRYSNHHTHITNNTPPTHRTRLAHPASVIIRGSTAPRQSHFSRSTTPFYFDFTILLHSTYNIHVTPIHPSIYASYLYHYPSPLLAVPSPPAFGPHAP